MYSNIAIIIITFAKEVEFSSAFVYLFVNRITQKNLLNRFYKTSGQSGHVKQGEGSPDEFRLEQTSYPFYTQLTWRYLGIK